MQTLHKCIVFGQHGDEYYMAMEYVVGVDLREVQRAVALQRKRIPLRIFFALDTRCFTSPSLCAYEG